MKSTRSSSDAIIDIEEIEHTNYPQVQQVIFLHVIQLFYPYKP